MASPMEKLSMNVPFMRGDTVAVTGKAELEHTLEGHVGCVNMAVYIPEVEAVISVSDDRTMRVWLKRDNGDFWPSVCQSLMSPTTCIAYEKKERTLFVGLESGGILEYQCTEDFNRVALKNEHPLHQARVNMMEFVAEKEWLFSVGRDKVCNWTHTEENKKLGKFVGDAWLTCLKERTFDLKTNHLFVGDFSGNIDLIKINGTKMEPLTTLKGHEGSIRSLAWDPKRQRLFSGSFDRTVWVWDIGGKKGRAFELHGHGAKVKSVVYVESDRRIMSAGDDEKIIFWDMRQRRQEPPEWKEADDCMKCGEPFFWNFKKKINANRQHHCRHCGKALCDKCTSKKSTCPRMGFELPVRMCDDCVRGLTEKDLKSRVQCFDAKHPILYMQWLDETRHLVTSGFDGTIKIWHFPEEPAKPTSDDED